MLAPIVISQNSVFVFTWITVKYMNCKYNQNKPSKLLKWQKKRDSVVPTWSVLDPQLACCAESNHQRVMLDSRVCWPCFQKREDRLFPHLSLLGEGGEGVWSLFSPDFRWSQGSSYDEHTPITEQTRQVFAWYLNTGTITVHSLWHAVQIFVHGCFMH